MRIFLKSFKHAIDGIIHTIRNERNFRIHLFILTFVVIFGIYFALTATEWLFITVISSMVLFAELINTAVENTLDWLEPGHHNVVKIVKDVCAGAVLVTAIGAIVMGIIIFTPHLVTLFLHK